ncbi:MAG: hypothetical protein ABEJ72_02075 [Candidatus Aenigmatarchaeota archaeon]
MKLEIEKTIKVLIVLTLLSLGLSTFSVYQNYTQGTGTNVPSTQTDASGNDIASKIQQIRDKVLPDKGSSTGYGVKYSTAGMQTMVDWFKQTSLSEEQRNRYIEIGTKKGTACEYCCGATQAVRSNGQSACGCEHNFALAGLIKHLVKNTDMTNEEILEEVHNWKAYFFPKQTLSEELQKRNISPEAAGLPQMRGGC